MVKLEIGDENNARISSDEPKKDSGSRPTTKRTEKKKSVKKDSNLAIIIVVLAGLLVYALSAACDLSTGMLTNGIYLATKPIVETTMQVSDMSHNFVDAVQNRDEDAAYALLSSDFKNASDKKEFTDFIERIIPTSDTKAKMKKLSIQGNDDDSFQTGSVVYEVVGSDGATYTFTVKTVQENGTWLVSGIDQKAKDNTN